MRLVFFGDVVGRAGRDGLARHLPEVRTRLKPDLIVVNGENAAGGFGITAQIAKEFYALGVDVITLGNHSFDQKETLAYIGNDPRLLRPRNYPPTTPGRGATTVETAAGRKVLVISVMGRIFMDPLDDPFASVEAELAKARLGGSVSAIVVDVHAEASSEKMAMAHVLDGRVSMVVGSHSHVPTADAQVLPGGTAYQTDAGMCGDYDSVIGMQKAEPIARFTRKIPGGRFEPATGEATVCGILVDTDDATGLAKRIEPIRVGGRLKPQWPPD
ncbi:YmdB family metallophosphoesterase [Zavarzinia sp.]|uniref:TIGR00282 family metallophosphoesterase n=1 Tax=Zavarzinia sp. TaxID=2027920 RepID=UPI003566E31B